jgi:hypothetical protein
MFYVSKRKMFGFSAKPIKQKERMYEANVSEMKTKTAKKVKMMCHIL